MATVPNLPVVLDLSTVTATKNGGIGPAEPYFLTVFFQVDGTTMKIVQRADGKLVLQGEPVIRRTASRHGNMPQMRDGETKPIPDSVGRFVTSMRPIPLSGDLGELVVGGASGVVGMLYVLNEEDGLSDEAILAGYDTLVRQFTAELKKVIAGIVIDPGSPGTNPFTISEEVKQAITERITAKVKATVLANSGLILNPDDPIGSDVVIYTEAALLADPVQQFGKRFDEGVPGDWTVRGSVTATVPADFPRRRRVILDLGKLACVTPTDPVGGDEPYMWNVFFTIDGSTVTLGENLKLAGTAAIVTTPGSHGNLTANGVSEGQTVEVPDSIGRFAPLLDLIRFPASLRDSLVGGVSGVIGCVSVLLDQDLVADDPAEAGHRAFNAEIKRVLDELIPTLGVGNASPSPDDLAALSGQIGEKVRAAILEEGNVLEDLFAGVDPDDVIGFKVLLFTHAALLADPEQTLTVSFNENGHYDLTATVTAVVA
ncbi:hypothetical protein C8D88_104135 [Lentzea atacamensis]|uniref:Uncharacterized protein n=1 Tax=Lentzea atacamensis TaxID=531938 RepID=A0A316I2X2_9PSEU|nr:hypothetical protein [Lentzea atacamensis]PWK86974.1 hypothetical protein C8D88_104135 [Lentzea atacamensis]